MRKLILAASLVLAVALPAVSSATASARVRVRASSITAAQWDRRWDARWDRHWNVRWDRQWSLLWNRRWVAAWKRKQAAAQTVSPTAFAVASWYSDASGACACGGCSTYGVANLSLACGTRVEFSYGGRSVQAVVDDRGPYVGGRTWDLNENTAAALGFTGVATIGYRIES